MISTRADPPLPLARLRARGELVEVRAADLRFTADEVAAYLDEVDGPGPGGRRRRGAGGAHRGVDRRPAAGGALAAGPRGRGRLHRRLRRRRPVRRRLPRRRGPGAAARGRPRRSCSRPRSWTGSAARCATRSRAGATAGPCSRRWTGRTCSSSPSTTTATGTATTTCSPTSCARTCWRSGRTRSRSCTAGRARGTPRPASPSRRSGTRSRPATSSTRPTWSSGPSRPCGGTGRRPRSGAGSTTLPPEVVRLRPVLAMGLIGALMSGGEFAGVESRLDDVERLAGRPVGCGAGRGRRGRARPPAGPDRDVPGRPGPRGGRPRGDRQARGPGRRARGRG